MKFYELLSRLGIDFIESGGGELRINCLHCDDNKHHLYINPSKGVFHCFKCGWSGGIKKLIYEIKQIYRVELPEEIDDSYLGFEEYHIDNEVKNKFIACKLPAGYFKLANEIGTGKEKALQYLFSRNIDFPTIEKYEIGYCNMGSFGGRIIFPIYYHGKLMSYIGRDILGRVPKVLNPPIWEADPPSRYLYNFDEAIFFPRLVITEGVFDCLTLQTIDAYTCAVASFGKKLTSAQIDLILSERFEEIIFAWDGDAVNEALKYSKLFYPIFEVKITKFPIGEDPNSLGKDKAVEYINRSEPVPDVELEYAFGY